MGGAVWIAGPNEGVSWGNHRVVLGVQKVNQDLMRKGNIEGHAMLERVVLGIGSKVDRIAGDRRATRLEAQIGWQHTEGGSDQLLELADGHAAVCRHGDGRAVR